MSFTTFPKTSVSRKSRPAYRYVNLSWSMPSRILVSKKSSDCAATRLTVRTRKEAVRRTDRTRQNISGIIDLTESGHTTLFLFTLPVTDAISRSPNLHRRETDATDPFRSVAVL